MKAIVTGGCGFLGVNLASLLLQKGCEVVVVDAMFRTGSARNREWLSRQTAAGGLTFHEVDIADDRAVDDVFARHAPVDYVCHLAGQVAMTSSINDPVRDFRTNALGTLNVLNAVRRFSKDALVAFSSTNKVYGDLEALRCVESETRYELVDYREGIPETIGLDFASPYGCSKGAGDQYVHDWALTYGLNTVVFRHSSIYGGRQFATFDQGWVGWFCCKVMEQRDAAAAGRPLEAFTIQGNGKQVRDLLHVEDAVQLYWRAFERRREANGEVFNIGGGPQNSFSLLELLAFIPRVLKTDWKPLYRQLAPRQSDQRVFIADIRKAEKCLGWSPRVSREEGVRRMVEWQREVSQQGDAAP